MEGLLPLVYKSLKKNKTRRKYECLSSGAAQSYNIADFHAAEDDHHYHHHVDHVMPPEPDKVSSLRGPHHRRYNSVHVDHIRTSFGSDDVAYDKPKQLVRHRSHRMFSCVTGA